MFGATLTGAMPATIRTQATPLFLGLAFVALQAIQLLVYRGSFAVKPSNDDFVALHQIERGETEGIVSFFRKSDFGDYRPLQNASFWLFGRLSVRHALLSLRVLHFLSFGFYAAVAFLWIRALRFSRIAGLVAAAALFLHPALAGVLGGLDNFARLVVAGWVWLGTWIAYRYGDRPRLAAPLVSICLAIGLGYMEYAVALIPLAVLAAWWREGQRRHMAVAFLLAPLLATLIVYLLVRSAVLTAAGGRFLSFDVLVWAKNTVLMVATTLFFGNTVALALDGSLLEFAWLGLNVTLVAAALGYGLWRSGADELREPSAGNPVAFLCIACGATFFPMVLMKHVSEIYLTTILLGMALLCGLAAEGLTTASGPVRRLALLLAFGQLVLAGAAIQDKVAGIGLAGERTEALLRQLLDRIAKDPRPQRVAMIFLSRDAGASRGYSVFALPDDQLVPGGYGGLAVRWYRPDLRIRLDPLLVRETADVVPGSYDVLLLWDPSKGQLVPLPSSTGQPGAGDSPGSSHPGG